MYFFYLPNPNCTGTDRLSQKVAGVLHRLRGKIFPYPKLPSSHPMGQITGAKPSSMCLGQIRRLGYSLCSCSQSHPHRGSDPPPKLPSPCPNAPFPLLILPPTTLSHPVLACLGRHKLTVATTGGTSGAGTPVHILAPAYLTHESSRTQFTAHS